MKNRKLIEELKKLPLDCEVEYHEGDKYQVASNFKFEVSERGRIVMMGTGE